MSPGLTSIDRRRGARRAEHRSQGSITVYDLYAEYRFKPKYKVCKLVAGASEDHSDRIKRLIIPQ